VNALFVAAAITESTPISIALAISVVAVAFFAGGAIEHLRGRVRTIERERSEQKQWNSKVDDVLTDLALLVHDHDRDLKLLQKDR
jgi:hypothetical protein